MPDFTDNLKPASPDGPKILSRERSQSNVPEEELSKHLLSRDGFLERQQRILKILEKDPLFKKVKQFNLSRPERYQLGLARAKKLRRYEDQYGWDGLDVSMAQYLCDDVSPLMVHYAMFVTTVREQASEEQRKYWMPRIENMEVVGCYAQ
jgi:acyl-CoA oxidase